MTKKIAPKNLDMERDIEEVMKPQKSEPQDQLYTPPTNSLGRIAFTFIGFAILLLVGIFYFSYSYTTIIVIPNPQVESFETEVTISLPLSKTGGQLDEIRSIIDSWTKNNPGILFGETVEVVAEGEETFTPISKSEVRKEPGIAHGKITIFNKQSTAQELVAQTRFVPEGQDIIFKIRKNVTIPANEKLEVEVFADKAGAQGNIGPSKFQLPGFSSEYKRKMVYGESYTLMTGGVKEINVLSQVDIDNAKTELQKKLFNQSLVELENKVKTAISLSDKLSEPQGLPTDEKLPGSRQKDEVALVTQEARLLPKATWQEALETSVDKTIGEEVEEFTLKMKLKNTAFIFNEEELLTVAKTNITKKLAEQEILALHSLDEKSLDYSIKTYNPKENAAILNATINGETLALSENLINKNELTALSPGSIQTYLDEHPEIKSIEIKEPASWLRKIPIFKEHVRIRIKAPNS